MNKEVYRKEYDDSVTGHHVFQILQVDADYFQAWINGEQIAEVEGLPEWADIGDGENGPQIECVGYSFRTTWCGHADQGDDDNVMEHDDFEDIYNAYRG